MLEWLENYLSSYGGGILIISHDRYFLDRVTTRIVELEHHKATSYRGNYSRYVEQREAQHKAQQKTPMRSNRNIFAKRKSISISTAPGLNLKWPEAASRS